MLPSCLCLGPESGLFPHHNLECTSPLPHAWESCLYRYDIELSFSNLSLLSVDSMLRLLLLLLLLLYLYFILFLLLVLLLLLLI
jgi:hypothetical protein